MQQAAECEHAEARAALLAAEQRLSELSRAAAEGGGQASAAKEAALDRVAVEHRAALNEAAEKRAVLEATEREHRLASETGYAEAESALAAARRERRTRQSRPLRSTPPRWPTRSAERQAAVAERQAVVVVAEKDAASRGRGTWHPPLLIGVLQFAFAGCIVIHSKNSNQ